MGIFSFTGRATHVMGGDITWACQGGNYIFQLVIYRDCNGADISTISEEIKVWGHPTVSAIQCAFVSRTDVSPFCAEVTSGPQAFACGSGANAGNGLGAIEKIVYQSAPKTLIGTPPAQGWVFSYEDFSRSGAITNLINPATKGITLLAKMFAIPGAGTGCVDNSPQFLQEPYFVSCSGESFEYNMNAVDPDLDSVHISFGIPYDYLNGAAYTAGVTPAPLAFETGFTFDSPTPGTGMNPANVSAQIDPSSGNLTFLSANSGSFNVKILAQSYRSGVLIAEVEREMLLIITNCTGTNNKPLITGPFGGLFETTISAGDLINFNLSSTDVEVLQDGTPQDNILSASGLMFGTNYTANTGCAITPCATLDATPLITMPQGVSTNFNWQTSCDHLLTQNGTVADLIPYHFVFKVQDNYCAVPKVSYATITINVENTGVIPAPQIDCIQTNSLGDVTLNWSPVLDPTASFNAYQIYSIQGGLLGVITDINTTTFTTLGVTQANNYYLSTTAGCDGDTERFSDTLSNIYLDLNNPGNGTAILQWNDPTYPGLTSMGAYYHIYREYPLGTWALHDSVPFGTNFYKDTITVCEDFFSYQVVLPNSPCNYKSNIQGDLFQDNISPDIPILDFVTIDTLSGAVTISWNQNGQEDTFGYVVYVEDASGAIVELDQVFGIGTTSYSYIPTTNTGPLTYSVAAFDSCWTTSVPPTYQTSAKGEIHTSTFLSSSLDICSRQIELSWTPYIGWEGINTYTIVGHIGTGGWLDFGSTTATNLSIDVLPGETYTFVIQANSVLGQESFSNAQTIYVTAPEQPAFNYLQVATVNNDEVDLRLYVDASVNILEASFQRLDDDIFVELGRVPATANQLTYTDQEVRVTDYSYTYRVQLVDSCGQLRDTTNEAKTILLSITNDEVSKINYLNWTAYHEYEGGILGYNIYRGKDGIFNPTPIASVPADSRSFVDDVYELVSKGKICYYIEAIEAMNIYNFSEISRSNEACITLPPLIFIPNAFTPEGLNPLFKPILTDFDPVNYDFTIFDRLGQVIYRTNTPTEGWNGRISFSGKMANTGTYLYMLNLRDGNGIEIIKRGHVTLLK
ncbi:MAG: gliding motility-associated C-terminal domain-containing protein [Crocinitomicaceae bacterium]|nr:gliding motility-associated C-terminal domain-containing protein [Crocinitomicaceae bacterium]MDG1777647.1 gliding motility-associated C-terminal domain-containing protein [Crocinitomicaceae bacterium]